MDGWTTVEQYAPDLSMQRHKNKFPSNKMGVDLQITDPVSKKGAPCICKTYSVKIKSTHFIIPNLFFYYRVNTNLANVRCTHNRWFMC